MPPPGHVTRRRSTGRTVLLLLGAVLAVVGLKAVTMQSDGPAEVRRLALGEGGTTSQGNEVTVLGWNERASSEPDLSEVDLKACRSKADQPLLSAGALSLEMPNGKTLSPEGSSLKIDGNCISGAVFFPDTRGTTPRSALYDRGSIALRWSFDSR
ncbi:MAG: hypothetical protein ACRD0C_15020 [Acidimicrobiia bacterium]